MYTEHDYLQAAISSGMIDLTTLHSQIAMAERKKYLEEHDQKVWQGKDGNWFTYLPHDGKRGVVKKTTLKAVEDAIVDFYRSEEQNPNIRQIYESWITEKLEMGEVKKGTFDKYNTDFNRWFNDIGSTKIKSISEETLEMFIRETIAKHGLSAKAYGNFRILVMGIFKYAKRKHITNISITTMFKDLQISRKSFTQKPVDKRTQVFSDDETDEIINYLKGHSDHVREGIILCFQTGIRVGELVALKYTDIEDGVLHIQRQEVKEKDASGKSLVRVVEYTKTEAGNRRVVLTRHALETIEKLKTFSGNMEFIMQRQEGNRIRCSTINKSLYRACEKCGIPPRSMHKVRRTYGTILIDSGVDDSIIMDQMGHSDIVTTRKYYYFGRNNQGNVRKQIENAVGEL